MFALDTCFFLVLPTCFASILKQWEEWRKKLLFHKKKQEKKLSKITSFAISFDISFGRWHFASTFDLMALFSCWSVHISPKKACHSHKTHNFIHIALGVVRKCVELIYLGISLTFRGVFFPASWCIPLCYQCKKTGWAIADTRTKCQFFLVMRLPLNCKHFTHRISQFWHFLRVHFSAKR